MPPPAPEVVEERAQWIFNKLNRFGITGIVTAQLDPVRLKAYRDLESKNKLTVRRRYDYPPVPWQARVRPA